MASLFVDALLYTKRRLIGQWQHFQTSNKTIDKAKTYLCFIKYPQVTVATSSKLECTGAGQMLAAVIS